MIRQSMRVRSTTIAVCVIAFLALASSAAWAQIEALGETPPMLEQASDIKTQPLLLLSKFPNAGPALARYVAQALTKQPAAVDAMLSILPDTSPEQAAAMGAGLVRALRSLMNKEPELVKQIVDKVMRTENVAFKTTFFAIGPRRAGTINFATLAPPGRLVSDMGNMGVAMTDNKSRVGVQLLDYNLPTSAKTMNKDGSELDLFKHGMIVAIIASDAASNGAIPTSPIY